MRTLSNRWQLAIGCALLALMIATRGHHFPTVKQALPSASWAAFFLAGIYLRPVWALGLFLAGAALLDYIAIFRNGVSSFCVSPAYAALVAAYGALWAAGRWYAARHAFKPATLVPLAVAVVVGALVCELISSGSFYFFSGRFADPTLAQFAPRLTRYFPSSLTSLSFWVAAAGLVHTLAAVTRRRAPQPTEGY
ncbi:MAG: hypothetical protein AB1768_08880 [Pseudomonadota bacterium]|jgi:hypothetical protein